MAIVHAEGAVNVLVLAEVGYQFLEQHVLFSYERV